MKSFFEVEDRTSAETQTHMDLVGVAHRAHGRFSSEVSFVGFVGTWGSDLVVQVIALLRRPSPESVRKVRAVVDAIAIIADSSED